LRICDEKRIVAPAFLGCRADRRLPRRRCPAEGGAEPVRDVDRCHRRREI